MYRKILVAVDGSEPSLKALKHAVELAKKHKSEIRVISVVEELKLPFGAEYRLWANESHQELIRNSIECLNEELSNIREKEPGIAIDAEIIEGNPADKIISFSEAENVDLIVMGKKGTGVFEGLVMGSVTQKVINKSRITVMVVI
jgi:nucleotide-binding universal stress UspA family protein